jgi:ribose transport system ATP-binding protein
VIVLEMRGISKSFFGVPVLSQVDLDCQAGEVHAIVGENGAGKSTLMKILAGAYQPDSGSIRLDGQEVHFGHPGEAKERGVSLIYQEFTLLPERTVAQNIFLGREPRRGLVVDARAMDAATHALLATLEVETTILPRPQAESLMSRCAATIAVLPAPTTRIGRTSSTPSTMPSTAARCASNPSRLAT